MAGGASLKYTALYIVQIYITSKAITLKLVVYRMNILYIEKIV